MLASRARQLVQPAHPESGDAISLDSGYGFAEIFPDLTDAARLALTTYRSESLQYGRPFGNPELCEWISSYLKDDGVTLSSGEIIVVNGAKNGLDLLCRLFTEEGDSVVLTGPTYFTAIPIFRSFGLQFVEIPQDRDGMHVDTLVERLRERHARGDRMPRFIYDIPDFHNPTGITMTHARREALLAAATAYGIPIVEDSPYRRLRFEGETEPSLKALDRDGIVLALGTFSKLLAPGLRVGWIGGPRHLLQRVARLKSDGGTCPLTQRIVLEFCKSGRLEPHIVHARKTYAAHRDCMVAALRRELPDAAFTLPRGGYYLWLQFPEGVDTDVLAERAYQNGVSVIAGPAFFAAPASEDQERARKRYMRLAYSGAGPAAIEEGVGRLAAAYRSMR